MGIFTTEPRHLRFAVKLACAVVLALFVGFHFQLETPRWAVLTAAIVAAALRVRVFSRRACSSKVKGKDKNHEKAKRGQSGLPRIPQTGSQDTVLTVW